MGQGCVRKHGLERPQKERMFAHCPEGNVGKSWLSGKGFPGGSYPEELGLTKMGKNPRSSARPSLATSCEDYLNKDLRLPSRTSHSYLADGRHGGIIWPTLTLDATVSWTPGMSEQGRDLFSSKTDFLKNGPSWVFCYLQDVNIFCKSENVLLSLS